jgi:hypothetical protein
MKNQNNSFDFIPCKTRPDRICEFLNPTLSILNIPKINYNNLTCVNIPYNMYYLKTHNDYHYINNSKKYDKILDIIDHIFLI